MDSSVLRCLQTVGAEALTDTLVELGHIVTIHFTFPPTSAENTYWYIQLQPQPPLAVFCVSSHGTYFHDTFC